MAKKKTGPTKSPGSPLLEAAAVGDLAAILGRLGAGDDVNEAGEGRRTPLYVAARGGHEDAVRALIEAGASLDALTWFDQEAEEEDLGGRLSDEAISKLATVQQSTGPYSFTISMDWGRVMAEQRARGPFESWKGQSALTAAIRRGHLGAARVLLDAGAPVDLPGDQKRTALNLAVRLGLVESVKFLLGAGADPNRVDAKEFTPLAIAVEAGRDDLAKLLKAAGGSMEKEGGQALCGAAKWGDIDRIKALLASGVSPAESAPDGTIPLLQAVVYDNLKAVQLLLDAGADPTLGNILSTPLTAAIHSNRPEMVAAFVRAGAVIRRDDLTEATEKATARGWAGMLAELDRLTVDRAPTLWDAVRAGDHALAARLAPGALPISVNMLVFEPAESGDAEMVGVLLGAGADPNAGDEGGRPLLSAAAENGHLDVVRLLVARKAKVNGRDGDDGSTALGHAAEGGHLEVMAALLDAGAKIRLDDMTRAAGGGSVEAIDLLVARGGKVSKSLMNLAAEEGQEAMVAHLAGLLGKSKAPARLASKAKGNRDKLARRRDVHPRAGDLILAAVEGNLEAVRSLVVEGVGVDSEMSNGVTALIVAARDGQAGAVALLLGLGADPGIRDDDGDDALAKAVESGQAGSVSLLIDASAARGIAIDGRALLAEAAKKGSVDVVDELIRRGHAEGDGSAEIAEARVAYLKEFRSTLKMLARLRSGTPRAGQKDPHYAKMVPGVLECLRSEGPEEAHALAAECLGLIGPFATDAIADLEMARDGGSPEIARAATKALKLIRADEESSE